MTAWATTAVATVEVSGWDGADVFATAVIDPAAAVFDGHYPGFPVLPGAYLIELADRASRLALRAPVEPGRVPPGQRGPAAGPISAPDGGWRNLAVELAMVERCRFLDPVYPGDPLTLQVRVTGPDANPVCSVQAGTPAGPVAEIRLRYRDRNAA